MQRLQISIGSCDDLLNLNPDAIVLIYYFLETTCLQIIILTIFPSLTTILLWLLQGVKLVHDNSNKKIW